MNGFRNKLISALGNTEKFTKIVLDTIISNTLTQDNNYLEELISISKIVITNKIPTAAMSYRKNEFVLSFNPDFIKKCIFSEECFFICFFTLNLSQNFL